MTIRTASTAKLADTPEETWANTILYRLATALGEEPMPGTNVIVADADAILDAAIRKIEATTLLWEFRLTWECDVTGNRNIVITRDRAYAERVGNKPEVGVEHRRLGSTDEWVPIP